ncbi:Chromo [Glarea lozoyensis ATCC 20868]|uniref:Chromatin modification-related protein EAF3 n=1 Tax=Glarea lozoyensis (strain ATCC 20868 / MF5171) TaxID=1116229 RepID=S3DTJ7_GLAL2|nr:Chromo [Glarea lozoyensis ATCC 20868]EPE35256.1 Chromo [Glarea lozoyensis ATCC 20868]
MAPKATESASPFAKDEKVLCFHHEMLYEAKVLDSQHVPPSSWRFKIHYKGWKNTWDDWVPEDRVRKFTDENKELAAQLHTQMKALQRGTKSVTKSSKKPNGSDFSSARGSEERHTSVAATGGRAGQRRNRDYDIETSVVVRQTAPGRQTPQLKAPPTTQLLVNTHSRFLYPYKSLDQRAHRGIITVFSPSLTTITTLNSWLIMATGSALASSSEVSKQESQQNDRGVQAGDSDRDSETSVGAVQNSPKRIGLPDKSPSPTAPPRKRQGTGKTSSAPKVTSVGQRATRSRAQEQDWNKINNVDWPIMKMLTTEECLAPDLLLKLPTKNHTYIDSQGRLRDPDKYSRGQNAPVAPEQPLKIHPTLARHIKNGTATKYNTLWYQNMDEESWAPLAGVIAPKSELRLKQPPSAQPSSEESENLPVDQDQEASDTIEENFHSRPSVKLAMPDQIKAILVDDWENVTKNQQLVPLPCLYPVNAILNDYFDYEKPKRQPGSPQENILEEVMAGLRDYFERCLGRILLYRFERQQYTEVREAWAGSEGDLAGKNACSTYGAEHLCRLLVTLPELIAQTNMDVQSVNRLREELTKMCNWIGRNVEKYFCKEAVTGRMGFAKEGWIVWTLRLIDGYDERRITPGTDKNMIEEFFGSELDSAIA